MAEVLDDVGEEVDELVSEDELEVELVLDGVDADFEGRKSAATLSFDDRKPAVTSPSEHPLVHGFVLQQPMKGGSVLAQVYHRLPVGHC